MKVHVLNHMRDDIIVHRVGCADAAKAIKQGRTNSDWFVDVPDGEDVATVVAADISADFGWPEQYDEGEAAPWRAENIKVYPCVNKRKE